MGNCCGRTCNSLLHEHGTFRCGTCQENKQVCKKCSYKYIRCCKVKYDTRQTSLCNDKSHNRFELQCPKCKVAIIHCDTCRSPHVFLCCKKYHDCYVSVHGHTPNGKPCSICRLFGCKGNCEIESVPYVEPKVQMCEWLDGCTNVAYKGYRICEIHNDCFKCGKNKYDKNLNTSTEHQIRGNFCSTCNHFHGDRCTHAIPIKVDCNGNKSDFGIFTSFEYCNCTNPLYKYTVDCWHSFVNMEEYRL